MHRTKWIALALFVVVTMQMALLMSMVFLLYQITPKSVLARDTFIGRIQPVMLLVRLADRAMNPLYSGPEPREEIPLYSIEVDQKDLQKLEKEIAKLDVFVEDDAKMWLPIRFSADGVQYKAKMRIRGDRFNHWKFRKKSWRIKFAKDQLFRGMRELTLLIPEDRAWHTEMVSHARAKQFGLLQPPMRYVGVSINGSVPLAYLEVEHWTKEMLEKQGYPGDVNFFNPGSTQTSSFDGWDRLHEDLGYSSKYLESAVSPHDSMEELELLFFLGDEDTVVDDNFAKKVETVFDKDLFIAWHAQSYLAGNLHASTGNMRVFFDPSRGRYIPIPWDIHSTTPRPLLSRYPNKIWRNAFRIPSWNIALQTFLWDYLSDEDQYNEDLDRIDHYRSQVEELVYRDPHKLQSNRQIEYDLNRREREMIANMDYIKEQLQISELLMVQRLPTLADREEGVGLYIDITVRGPVASLFSGVILPQAVDATNLALVYEDALLAPEQPPIDALGFPTEIPHTQYRITLEGVDLTLDDLPVDVHLYNAVTGMPSQVVNTVVVDEQGLADSATISP